MSILILCFGEKITKIFTLYPLLSRAMDRYTSKIDQSKLNIFCLPFQRETTVAKQKFPFLIYEPCLNESYS